MLVKKLTKVGNGYAMFFSLDILEMVNADPRTSEFEITTDGTVIQLRPRDAAVRRPLRQVSAEKSKL